MTTNGPIKTIVGAAAALSVGLAAPAFATSSTTPGSVHIAAATKYLDRDVATKAWKDHSSDIVAVAGTGVDHLFGVAKYNAEFNGQPVKVIAQKGDLSALGISAKGAALVTDTGFGNQMTVRPNLNAAPLPPTHQA